MKRLLVIALFAALLFCLACQSKLKDEFSKAPLSDSTSVFAVTGDSVKLVKTASINFKVKDVQKATRAISVLARKMDGMVHNDFYEAGEGEKNRLQVSSDSIMVVSTYTPRADITARVPSENLDDFLFSLADLGYFTQSSRINIEDKTLVFLQNTLRQKNRNSILAMPEKTKAQALTKLASIGVTDNVIDQHIANRVIDADAAYSTVNLSLFQNALVKKETIANDAVGDYTLPFKQRMALALGDGWQNFLSFIIVLANLWVLITLALATFIFYRFVLQKRKLPELKLRAS